MSALCGLALTSNVWRHAVTYGVISLISLKLIICHFFHSSSSLCDVTGCQMEMTEMVDGHRKYGSQGGTIPLSSSPLSSPCCRSTQTWLQVESPPRLFWNDQQMEGAEELGQCHDRARASDMPSGRFYEELFCTSQTSIPLIGALMPSSGQQSDVVKHGYLGKLERSHRRYFVLRTGSHTGPSRLEWYKTQEKFTAMEKSSGKAVLFGPSKQGFVEVTVFRLLHFPQWRESSLFGVPL